MQEHDQNVLFAFAPGVYVLDFQSVSIEEAFRDICVLRNCVFLLLQPNYMDPKKKVTGIACRRFFDEFIPCFVPLTYCFATKILCWQKFVDNQNHLCSVTSSNDRLERRCSVSAEGTEKQTARKPFQYGIKSGRTAMSQTPNSQHHCIYNNNSNNITPQTRTQRPLSFQYINHPNCVSAIKIDVVYWTIW